MHLLTTKRTHKTMITSLLRQSDITTSFWCKDDVIITLCVRWQQRGVSIILFWWTFFSQIMHTICALLGLEAVNFSHILQVYATVCIIQHSEIYKMVVWCQLDGFSSQRDSNRESVSMSGRHHRHTAVNITRWIISGTEYRIMCNTNYDK